MTTCNSCPHWDATTFVEVAIIGKHPNGSDIGMPSDVYRQAKEQQVAQGILNGPNALPPMSSVKFDRSCVCTALPIQPRMSADKFCGLHPQRQSAVTVEIPADELRRAINGNHT